MCIPESQPSHTGFGRVCPSDRAIGWIEITDAMEMVEILHLRRNMKLHAREKVFGPSL